MARVRWRITHYVLSFRFQNASRDYCCKRMRRSASLCVQRLTMRWLLVHTLASALVFLEKQYLHSLLYTPSDLEHQLSESKKKTKLGNDYVFCEQRDVTHTMKPSAAIQRRTSLAGHSTLADDNVSPFLQLIRGRPAVGPHTALEPAQRRPGCFNTSNGLVASGCAIPQIPQSI